MKKIILILTSILISAAIYGQEDIFKTYGIKEPLTLSKGRFVERFPNKEIVRIGTVMYNTKTKKVIEFLEEDTTVYAYHAELSSRWFTVDPLAEKFPQYSPYVYCANNPIKFIDTDGMDIWGVNNKGQVKWVEESKTHMLYSVDDKGKRTDKSITVNDRGILDQLSKPKTIEKVYSDGYTEKLDSRTAITDKKGADDMVNVFMFMADNTAVEWNFSRAKEDGEEKYGLKTLGDRDQTKSPFAQKDIITNIHSHPDVQTNITDEQSTMGNDRYYSKSRTSNEYVYFPISTRLYKVENGKSTYVRHINRNPKRFINIK